MTTVLVYQYTGTSILHWKLTTTRGSRNLQYCRPVERNSSLRGCVRVDGAVRCGGKKNHFAWFVANDSSDSYPRLMLQAVCWNSSRHLWSSNLVHFCFSIRPQSSTSSCWSNSRMSCSVRRHGRKNNKSPLPPLFASVARGSRRIVGGLCRCVDPYPTTRVQLD